MTLITRLGRLFKADFHAVLDQIEEPETLLRQAIREMEEELGRQEQGIRIAKQEQAESIARRRQLEERAREIDEELDLCFASGEEGLAKGLVRRKLEVQRLGRHLATGQEGLAESLERLESAFAGNRKSLAALRQKAELMDVHKPAVDDDPSGWMGRDTGISEDEIDVAFLKEKASRVRA